TAVFHFSGRANARRRARATLCPATTRVTVSRAARICPNCVTRRAQSPCTLSSSANARTAMLPDLRIWLNHFEYHAQHPRRVPPELSDVLTQDERKLIASSIATFQRGEHSDGRTLLAAVRRLAHARAAPELERITELFIREEQRHVTLLAEFMRDHSIPLKRHHWTEFLFRLLRGCASFQFALNVLIAAELIGNVYYRALESVTGCQRLRILCRTLVADELAHIGFFSELLRGLRAQGPRGARAF